ncbi:hypothetical protein [Rhizobium leguminosarum]|uniref:hypothetical protein n=1 Tax=Rhizobium leguminosarum TaxID=384 RepID=UPI0013DC53C8|nr:hypothetical protein [Rhizobium leguminosarum]NEK33121.1 hypothetical protein [Rhizobium leguminosarum]
MEMHLYTVDSRWVAGWNRVAGMCELTMAPASRRRLTTPIASPEPRVTIKGDDVGGLHDIVAPLLDCHPLDW